MLHVQKMLMAIKMENHARAKTELECAAHDLQKALKIMEELDD